MTVESLVTHCLSIWGENVKQTTAEEDNKLNRLRGIWKVTFVVAFISAHVYRPVTFFGVYVTALGISDCVV